MRPIRFPSLSLTWQRSRADACSSLGASGWSRRTSCHCTPRTPSSTDAIAAFATSAFAGMSSPHRTKLMLLRKPPTLLVDTFTVAGGGAPRTPATRTRSGPSSFSSIVSKRATTSGPRYAGLSIS